MRGQVIVDALSARLGGGLSYLTNQLVALERVAPQLDLHVLADPANHAALADALRAPITIIPGGRLRPLVEQARLPWWGRPGDVLYCPGNFAPLLPTRARVVLTLQNPNYFGAGRHAAHNQSLDRTVRSRLARLSAARADRIIVISEALLAALAEDLPDVAARADLVPSGGPAWPDVAARPHALPADVRDFILVLANDAPHKHVDRVVAAWSTALGALDDPPPLVIAGGFFDPTRADEQRALVARRLLPHFHQIGAVTDRAEVRWLLEHARVLVSAASLEAHPLTPAEAGSLGCPLVLSDIAAHREVAGDHARYVVPGDAAALGEALLDIAEHPPRRGSWQWPISWDDNARQLAAIFTAELAGGAGSAPDAPTPTFRSPICVAGDADPRPEPRPPTPITVFTNIPNPYNDRLYAALRDAGTTVHVVYKRAPADEGRPWPLDLHPDERIASSLMDEARAWRAATDTNVILSGSYATATDLARRAATSPRARTLHVWGERLRPNNAAVQQLRRAYLARLGLDGVLAVGSRAVETYLEVIGDGPGAPPVHAFPYTTDRGLDVARAPSDVPTIGYAGRLQRGKGVDVIVQAMAEIAPPERPRLEVAGDGPAATALAAQARALGVDGAVTWLGALTPDELDRRRAAWWVQVVPSQRNEGWGVVVHEAMCSGVAVLTSTNVNAAVDLLRDGQNGVVIDAADAEDPRAWAVAVTAMIADEDGREAMAAEARRTGAAFGPSHAATFLLEVLGAPPRGTSERPATRSFIDEGWRRVREDASAAPSGDVHIPVDGAAGKGAEPR